MSGGKSHIKLAVIALAAGGAALLTFLLVRYGMSEIAKGLAAAKWGVLLVVLWHTVPLFMDTLSWWNLFPKECRPSLRATYLMRWMGESVSFLLPMSAVGGDIVRARLASQRGVPAETAAASVVADITLGIFVQAVFTLLGVALLIPVTGQSGMLLQVAGGFCLVVVCIGGFYAVQRIGMFRLLGGLVKRLASDPAWHALAERGGDFDKGVRSIYGNRRSVLSCCLCTMGAWLASSTEVWIALRAMGLDATFAQAIILESMSQGVRAVTFFIPGALGVQELGYLEVGKMLGIDPGSALTLSIIRRARELALGLPGLIAWQLGEGHRLWRKRGIQAAE